MRDDPHEMFAFFGIEIQPADVVTVHDDAQHGPVEKDRRGEREPLTGKCAGDDRAVLTAKVNAPRVRVSLRVNSSSAANRVMQSLGQLCSYDKA